MFTYLVYLSPEIPHRNTTRIVPDPSTGLRHPPFNHCRIYSYAIGPRKLSANEQFLLLLVLEQ